MGGETTATFTTAGGVAVTRRSRDIAYPGALEEWVRRLDGERGAVFSSSYEYPGRYTRWDFALVNPPLAVESRGHRLTVSALDARGRALVRAAEAALTGVSSLEVARAGEDRLEVTVIPAAERFPEEERSRQPTVFTALRALVAFFASEEDANLGLAGAFGYDLAFQFEPMPLSIERPADVRDLVLYLPDEILVVDHYARRATVSSYDFAYAGETSASVHPAPTVEPFRPADGPPPAGDHLPGEYADVVRRAFGPFARGELFEVVPSQVFRAALSAPPSALSRRLSEINPSPYGFFINLGNQEYVVGASPEMFVRVTGRRVETCPISGTIARGRDAIEDEAQIRKLLNSEKDETELTMCSDVDRNDKARVCVPGSVRVLGRRQIEMYSRLIHTVDHIEGMLAPGRDGLDAFLSHAWAVTVTGAPKRRAMAFIEANERGPRRWYGGAVGLLHFNGDVNTGLTLRTVHVRDGFAEVRVGATLLADSDPDAEERETVLKASAMMAAIETAGEAAAPEAAAEARQERGPRRRALLVDHEDSFVHTLAGYLREAGLEVVTLRAPVGAAEIDGVKPDVVVLSPGPGRPADFDTAGTIAATRERRLPVFGVCLGLQAIAEAYGARLGQIDVPMHGKPSEVRVDPDSCLFEGLPRTIRVGRYHSLVALPESLPPELRVTARTEDGVVMAVEHAREPVAAVQFHPESIMTLANGTGMAIVRNVVARLVERRNAPAPERADA